MELVVWNAARRLAVLVLGALVYVAIPFVMDAHVGTFPAASGALALALLAVALVPLRRARRMIEIMAQPARAPTASHAYRDVAKADDLDPVERAAAHHAAIALLLLAFAGSLVVVAAASR